MTVFVTAVCEICYRNKYYLLNTKTYYVFPIYLTVVAFLFISFCLFLNILTNWKFMYFKALFFNPVNKIIYTVRILHNQFYTFLLMLNIRNLIWTWVFKQNSKMSQNEIINEFIGMFCLTFFSFIAFRFLRSSH